VVFRLSSKKARYRQSTPERRNRQDIGTGTVRYGTSYVL
jgi:hypothetical protein